MINEGFKLTVAHVPWTEFVLMGIRGFIDTFHLLEIPILFFELSPEKLSEKWRWIIGLMGWFGFGMVGARAYQKTMRPLYRQYIL